MKRPAERGIERSPLCGGHQNAGSGGDFPFKSAHHTTTETPPSVTGVNGNSIINGDRAINHHNAPPRDLDVIGEETAMKHSP